MSTKKKTAGAATPNGQKENNVNPIIAVPLDVVNMSDEEIITAAIGRLEREDREAKYDRYGGVLHTPVCAALSEFCRQNTEFAQAVCQSDKHFGDCVKAVAKGVTTILFIRKAAEPDKPFFTVEVDNSGKIRQCYGERNKPAFGEVKEFRERYQHYLTEVFENAKRTERKLQQSA